LHDLLKLYFIILYLREMITTLSGQTHNPHATNTGDQSGEATADRPLGISTPTTPPNPTK
jgi:hypothetical protein